MISFYPGPSRVYDNVPKYVKEAHKKGFLSINHRSDEFMKVVERTDELLKEKLKIPQDYTILYTSSATECWEIIAQSFPAGKSHHIYNGAFGEKWFQYTKKIRQSVRSHPFNREELVNPNKFRFADQDGVICITQNETSNGTQVSNKVIWQIRENNPNHLIAIDTTSSMAGVALNFESADLWLASVQKCFGLPAGLGLLICSPRAVERAKAMNKNSYYNSFVFMHEMMQKWQTSYTPNVLGVYLLMRVMEDADYIDDIQAKTIKRYFDWIEFFGETKGMNHLIKNEEAHSFTVIPVATNSEASIKKIKSEAKGEGLLLGEGYGELKATTFRIANFPAIKKSEIKKLQQFLKSFDR